ncbi:MAG: hypothetical protein AUJ52_13205 [Elusimicrobia bacterium CG1_02_63_36]|nr:MAG: hypothetical protein AUJ52_13205 [Elusimicrobia bacterium CG1_02_63_36]
MKRMTMLAAVLALAGAGTLAAKDAKDMKGHGHHDAKMMGNGEKVTLKGEVIDLSCYMSHEAKGKKHASCAKSCVLDKGLPIGLLTEEGKVFMLIEDHGAAKAYKQVKQLAAEQVEIRGKGSLLLWLAACGALARTGHLGGRIVYDYGMGVVEGEWDE